MLHSLSSLILRIILEYVISKDYSLLVTFLFMLLPCQQTEAIQSTYFLFGYSCLSDRGNTDFSECFTVLGEWWICFAETMEGFVYRYKIKTKDHNIYLCLPVICLWKNFTSERAYFCFLIALSLIMFFFTKSYFAFQGFDLHVYSTAVISVHNLIWQNFTHNFYIY